MGLTLLPWSTKPRRVTPTAAMTCSCFDDLCRFQVTTKIMLVGLVHCK